MTGRLPEQNKVPGVYYADTNDGVELPIVDITHPAFALSISDRELRGRIQQFLEQGPPLGFLPRPMRNLLLRFFLRDSVLASGIRQAKGTFLTGMNTYLLKLGPQMLGRAYAKPIDLRIAQALPTVAVRLRLEDMANLICQTLRPALDHEPDRPLHFINIAGGPAMDTLNALILLKKNFPGTIERRKIAIYVLDSDENGPAFGARALTALSAHGGPLEGFNVTFQRIHYDWSKPADLGPVLERASRDTATVLVSSEGGLFEYGSDDDIVGNLEALRGDHGQVLAVVGSVTRADEPIQRLKISSRAATRPRGLETFARLIQSTGWRVTTVIERPFSDHLVLT